ncbi:MAG: transcriptional regulator [Pirellulales bacterium]|nr:transcriptional regulator [Pirellulales bacterium]
MSVPARSVKRTSDELPKEIIDLVSAIGEMSDDVRGRLEPVLVRVVESTKRRRRILQLVQDALGQLRLDMKYLMFDLEATRRERDDYRRQLEETP